LHECVVFSQAEGREKILHKYNA